MTKKSLYINGIDSDDLFPVPSGNRVLRRNESDTAYEWAALSPSSNEDGYVAIAQGGEVTWIDASTDGYVLTWNNILNTWEPQPNQGGEETLAETLAFGNSTDGINIDLTSGSKIVSSDGDVTVDDNINITGDGSVTGDFTINGKAVFDSGTDLALANPKDVLAVNSTGDALEYISAAEFLGIEQESIAVLVNGQQAFTLSEIPISDGYVMMFVNGMKQQYGVDYFGVGTSITYNDTDLVTTDVVEFFYNTFTAETAPPGGIQTLADTLLLGNVTGGTDVVISGGDAIVNTLGSTLNIKSVNNGAGATDDVVLSTGDSLSDSGGIFLRPGSSGSTRGLVNVDGDGYVSGNFSIAGKLDVDGLIDPTGLVLNEQLNSPNTNSTDEGSLWVKDDGYLIYTDQDNIDYVIGGPGIGGGSLATTLSIGNVTGGTNIELTSGDLITDESAGDGIVIETKSELLGLLGSGSINLVTAPGFSGSAGDINLNTGYENSGPGGNINITTGNPDSGLPGTGQAIGGDITIEPRGFAGTGKLFVRTIAFPGGSTANDGYFGSVSDGSDSGDIYFTTEGGADAGDVFIGSRSLGSTSGSLNIFTEAPNGGPGSPVNIWSTSSGGGGDIGIKSYSTTGNSGDIEISTEGSGPPGNIDIHTSAPTGSAAAGDILLESTGSTGGRLYLHSFGSGGPGGPIDIVTEGAGGPSGEISIITQSTGGGPGGPINISSKSAGGPGGVIAITSEALNSSGSEMLLRNFTNIGVGGDVRIQTDAVSGSGGNINIRSLSNSTGSGIVGSSVVTVEGVETDPASIPPSVILRTINDGLGSNSQNSITLDGASATVGSTGMVFKTSNGFSDSAGSFIFESGRGDSGSSGGFSFTSGLGDAQGSGGIDLTTGEGFGGASGSFTFTSGIGGGGPSGSFLIETGNSNGPSTSGSFSFTSGGGASGGSGGFDILTGPGEGGQSGSFSFLSGDGNSGGSGGFSVVTGPGQNGNAGDIDLNTGYADSSPGGNINIITGSSTSSGLGIGGDITIEASGFSGTGKLFVRTKNFAGGGGSNDGYFGSVASLGDSGDVYFTTEADSDAGNVLLGSLGVGSSGNIDIVTEATGGISGDILVKTRSAVGGDISFLSEGTGGNSGGFNFTTGGPGSSSTGDFDFLANGPGGVAGSFNFRSVGNVTGGFLFESVSVNNSGDFIVNSSGASVSGDITLSTVGGNGLSNSGDVLIESRGIEGDITIKSECLAGAQSGNIRIETSSTGAQSGNILIQTSSPSVAGSPSGSDVIISTIGGEEGVTGLGSIKLKVENSDVLVIGEETRSTQADGYFLAWNSSLGENEYVEIASSSQTTLQEAFDSSEAASGGVPSPLTPFIDVTGATNAFAVGLNGLLPSLSVTPAGAVFSSPPSGQPFNVTTQGSLAGISLLSLAEPVLLSGGAGVNISSTITGSDIALTPSSTGNVLTTLSGASSLFQVDGDAAGGSSLLVQQMDQITINGNTGNTALLSMAGYSIATINVENTLNIGSNGAINLTANHSGSDSLLSISALNSAGGNSNTLSLAGDFVQINAEGGSGSAGQLLTADGTGNANWQDPAVDSSLFSSTVQTGNAAPTRITGLATLNDTVIIVDVKVVAMGSSGTNDNLANGYKLTGVFKNNGGTLTQVGTTSITVEEEEVALWDVSFTISVSDIDIIVTGDALTQVEWLVSGSVVVHNG